jgi:hypothetical protein
VLVKVLTGAHRWKRLLESACPGAVPGPAKHDAEVVGVLGRFGSLAVLAAGEKIDWSYLGRTLRLTLLAGYRRGDLGRTAGVFSCPACPAGSAAEPME